MYLPLYAGRFLHPDTATSAGAAPSHRISGGTIEKYQNMLTSQSYTFQQIALETLGAISELATLVV